LSVSRRPLLKADQWPALVDMPTDEENLIRHARSALPSWIWSRPSVPCTTALVWPFSSAFCVISVGRSRRRAAEHQHPDQYQCRRQLGDIERQQLHDEGRADIRAQHRRQGRDQLDDPAGGEPCHHQSGRRAALQKSGDTYPREKRSEATAQCPPQEAAKPSPEGTLHAALDHMDGPQQQGHGSSQLQQGDGEVHGLPPNGQTKINQSLGIP
jgi:hypothetical protein